MAVTWIETDTNPNKDIRTAVSVGVYTSTGDKFVMPQLLADQVAGGGDYVYYLTLQVNGAGSHYVFGPKTTHTAAAGETAVGAQGIFIFVRSGDVLTVYIDGLAGDETTPDVTVRWAELDASANTTQLAGQTVTAAAGVTFPSSIASPTNITAGTINSVSGTVSANVVQIDGETTPVDNLVLALGNSDGITAHPQGIADAVNNLAPASAPAAGSIGDHLDDLATALAAATATLTVVSAVDGGELTIYQAVSFQATISGLSIPADWTKVYWTVKRATSEADADAILQLVETNPASGTDGLLRLNGAAGTAANGTLTVSQAAGTVVIDLVMTICDDLALATGLVWSLKALRPTSASTLLAIGTVNVLGQATMAVA